MTAAARTGLTERSARAQSVDPHTSALTWVEAEHPDVVPDPETGLRTFELEAPFYAIAPTWSGEAADDVLVELSVSVDGSEWSDPVTVGEAVHDAGPPDRDGRRFGELQLAEGASYVRYRSLNSRGELITVPGLAFTCIDSTFIGAAANSIQTGGLCALPVQRG